MNRRTPHKRRTTPLPPRPEGPGDLDDRPPDLCKIYLDIADNDISLVPHYAFDWLVEFFVGPDALDPIRPIPLLDSVSGAFLVAHQLAASNAQVRLLRLIEKGKTK